MLAAVCEVTTANYSSTSAYSLGDLQQRDREMRAQYELKRVAASILPTIAGQALPILTNIVSTSTYRDSFRNEVAGAVRSLLFDACWDGQASLKLLRQNTLDAISPFLEAKHQRDMKVEAERSRREEARNEELRKLLENGDVTAARTVLGEHRSSLYSFAAPLILPILVAELAKPKDALGRSHDLEQLAELGALAEPALPALHVLAKRDSDETTRSNAKFAIESIKRSLKKRR
jgi:hypothetical protein